MRGNPTKYLSTGSSCQPRFLSRTRLVLASAALLLLGALLLPTNAEAQTATRKFGRGLAGITTCFLEIPGHMVQEGRKGGTAQGLTLGFVKGLGGLVVRPLIGVFEVLTAPFEIPKGYAPIIEPEFPWSYFEEPSS